MRPRRPTVDDTRSPGGTPSSAGRPGGIDPGADARSGGGTGPGVRGAGAIALSFVLDALVSEPPRRVHPVALFGSFVAPVDREWRFPRLIGVLASLSLPLLSGGVAAAVVSVAARYSAPVGRDRGHVPGETSASRSVPLDALVAGGVLFSTTSLRMLTDTARAVVADTDTDLSRARGDLRALAGRDSTALSPAEVRSAAVESAGENLADGFVAPLLAFSLVAPRSLPAATGAAAWVKAVNTMDSMLGYRSTPAGWAPARLDDLVMWVPARLAALSIALAAADPTAPGEAGRWAREPPSPNSGWPMATLAAILDVRLEKPGVYALNSQSSLPTEADATAGIDLVDRAGIVVTLLASVLVALAGLVLADGADSPSCPPCPSSSCPSLFSSLSLRRWIGWS